MSVCKERGILFSAPMVRALLDGRKTVTRRAIKHQPDVPVSDAIPKRNFPHAPPTADWYWRPQHGHLNGVPSQGWNFRCPYGQPGDRLWVREAWAADAQLDTVAPRDLSRGEPILYPADGVTRTSGCSMISQGRGRPSIHIPRWASRILLEITDVRVERLQAGEGETAFESRYVAEGINRIHHGDGEYYFHAFKDEAGPGNWIDPFDAWRELWVSISGAEAWNTNPWVWVVEFKRVMP